MVLERLLEEVEPILVRLEVDDVLLHEGADEEAQMPLRVHERGPAALAGLASGDVVAEHALQELQALGPGGLEHTALGEVDQAGPFERRRVLARRVPIGRRHGSAVPLVEHRARGDVGVVQR